MRTFSVSFFIGTLVLLWLPRLLAVHGLFYLAGLLLVLLVGVLSYWRGWGKWPVVCAAGVVAGALYAVLVASQVREQWLPEAWEGQDVLLSGALADVPESRADGLGFLLDVDHPDFHGRLRVAWYEDDLPQMRAGERWQLLLRGKRPNGFVNPNGFDYEQWLFAQRIGGSAYVRKSGDNRRLGEAPLLEPDNIRQYIKEKIDVALQGSAMTGLVQGLAVAYTDAITQEQWTVFRKTGTIHLLAISGLHITMVAAAGILPVLLLWRLFPVLYLWLPVRIAGGIVGGGLATGYSLLAGFNIPTQRTWLMLMVMLAGLVWRRQIPFSVTLSVALLLVLLLDPLAPLSVGFWLSFLTMGLLVFLGVRQRKAGKGAAIGIQLLLSLGTVPVVAGFFGMVSLSSPLANMVAIPVVTFVVTPLVLLGIVLCAWFPWGAAMLWQWAGTVLEWLMVFLGWLADFSLSAVYIPLIPLAWLMVGFAGFVLLWLPRGMPGRWLGALLMLPLALYQPARPEPGAFRADMLDVGQGLASVVQTAGHTLVFDTGPKASDSFDTGALVLLPWLRGQGVSRVDRLVVSHADNDHSGGAPALLAEMPVGDILVSTAETLPGREVEICSRGQQWMWDGVTFTVVHPSAGFTDKTDNNRSCVLRVANAYHSMLLTADIERLAENNLLQQDGNLAAEVLLVPHHGSKTSSGPAFIDAVAPKVAVVTSGYRNRFHHPAPSVQARYEQRGIMLLNTVDTGELEVDFPASADAFAWRGERLVQPYFWRR
jgi:competence protein ComEC